MLCGFVPGVSIVDEPAAAADPPAGDDVQQVLEALRLSVVHARAVLEQRNLI